MTFHVGQRVVCVDDECSGKYIPRGYVGYGGLDGLKRGQVYTVRASGVGCGEFPVIWLHEIIRPIYGADPSEPGFASARFRPVQERKHDLSIFYAMLNPANQTVGA